MVKLKKDIVVVTGAAGFLGQRVVMQAIDSGYRVRAVVRPGRDVTGMPWFSEKNVEVVETDLADESCDFSRFIGNGDTSTDLAHAVVHSAGIIAGSREQHEMITVNPMRRLVEAMNVAGCRKLVHISSIAVYGYAQMPDGGQLDEMTPTELDLDDRDEYCRAKCMQEQIILEMVKAGFVEAAVLRPGVLCGYDQYWTSRLGIKRAGVLLNFNRLGRLPMVFVDHCADAVVLAVKHKGIHSDKDVKSELPGERYGFEIINIVEDYQPTQEEYLGFLRDMGMPGYRIRLSVPWIFAKTIISGISIAKVFFPAIYRKLPLPLRKATFHARMKGLRYCNARLKDRLGWNPQQDSKDCIADSWKSRSETAWQRQ